MEPQEIALPMTGYAAESSDAPGALIRRAQAGDMAAFEEMMTMSERRVVAIALRLLNNRQDAQDAAQEVYLRLYRNLKKLDSERGFESWLFRVTVNVCRDMARKRGQEAAPIEETAEMASQQADAHVGLEQAERREMVRRGLSRLGDKERAAVVLRDVGGLSTREVAEILGSSETTVRSQISTARLKLREFTGRWLRRQA